MIFFGEQTIVAHIFFICRVWNDADHVGHAHMIQVKKHDELWSAKNQVALEAEFLNICYIGEML